MGWPVLYIMDQNHGANWPQRYQQNHTKMKPEIITAIIAACVAVLSAGVSLYGQVRIAQLTDRLARKREAESKEAQTAALMSKYRDPLLRSAIDLQSRLYNIHQNHIFENFDQKEVSEQDYLVHNTLYVIAEYFGWVEILRREVQFLDLGDYDLNRRLGELLVNITKAFGTNRHNGHHPFDRSFQLFNGEQRAIGEIMMTSCAHDHGSGYECLGYAAFVQQMDEPEFSRWFKTLKTDLKAITQASQPQLSQLQGERLVLIHSRLIDLIDFLDPNCVRVPLRYRTRIQNLTYNFRPN